MSNTSPNLGVQYLEVGANSVGQRLDNFLLSQLKGAPKTLIYRIIRKGEVRVNKKRSQAATRLELQDLVRVPPLRLSAATSLPEVGAGLTELLLGKALVYENAQLLVINKPAGLAVHGGSGIQLGLIEALRQVRQDLSFVELVHRIDKDTSGCILVAKSRQALNFLQDQLRAQTMGKRYLAWVEGAWPANLTQIDAPIGQARQAGGEKIMQVSNIGKAAVTRFQLLEHYKNFSQIVAEPITGRTHQIRVHAQHAGYPLLGDSKYAPKHTNVWLQKQGVKRMFLHAHSLEFLDPDSNKVVTVSAPVDANWHQITQL